MTAGNPPCFELCPVLRVIGSRFEAAGKGVDASNEFMTNISLEDRPEALRASRETIGDFEKRGFTLIGLCAVARLAGCKAPIDNLCPIFAPGLSDFLEQ